MHSPRSFHSIALAFATAGICIAAGMSGNAFAQAVIAPGTTDLLATPPELTASVEPNIVVTFDDSGSMASHYMGDGRPFDNSGWGAPWGCAGVIDPAAPAGDIRAHAMNGVYYNPNVLYTPPVKADGTSFPNADATLASVWADGIAVNRPRNPVTPGTAGDNDNPDSDSGGNDSRRTNIIGIKSGSTDKRWTCGYGSYPTAFVGGENVNNGGPYYYRYKSSAPAIPVDTFGNPTGPAGTSGTGLNRLYNTANWEAVRLPNTTVTIEGVSMNQWQNFANWYAYYRTRNLMTRTALSRTFGKFSGNVRVAWQNINDGTFKLPSTAIITKLLDKAGVSCGTTDPATSFATGAQPDCYRSAFFNWVFETGASGTTPDRASTIRAGDFFKRGNTGNLRDPYWQLADASAGTTGRELSCRQNFHMLVTDGYWNEGDPTLPSPFYTSEAGRTLPDGTAFSNSDLTSRVYWDVDGNIYTSSLANIAFNYWAQDLRTDLDDKVKPFIPDKTTGITGSTPVGQDPLANAEVYFNPANDPATWQHVVQFMVTLGIAGNLNFSDDVDCGDPNSDICKLRKGLPNSAGITGWPRPSNNAPPAIDDTWHAAINSRGSYFSASNPGDLVSHLEAIINNVLARGASSTPTSISLPLATAGNNAYSAGYDSSDWSGSLIHGEADPNTQDLINPDWDAGCILTGGTFDTGTARCTQPSGGPWVSPPGYPGTARNPDSRRIFTSKRTVTGTVAVPFKWNTTALGTELVDGLNQKPTDTTLCNSSTNVVACDAYGTNRINYLRGYRNNEATPTPHFRTRSSVLGAVINAAPLYVSSPRGGFYDTFPIGSPEQAAFITGNSYAAFQEDHRGRRPMVYVGSNDGMLHAFDADSGAESWAFVPSTLIQNRRLPRSTADIAGLTPGVDSAPREADVFLGGSWHTILLGSLRLGGRGIYALDVTDVPDASMNEATVATKTVLWEFNSGPTRDPASVPANDPVCSPGATTCASLGYTYDAVNVARIRAGNKWVAVVSSGYFPSRSSDAAIANDASEPAAKHTSLLVIDLSNGTLIREIRTDLAPQTRPSGFKTYGLSTPTVYDVGNDQIADYVYAGDLAGNLWRFDLSDANSSNWKVDLLFSTYGTGGAAAVGDQPIVYNPTALRDPITKRPILVFGTGKYLGRDDRTSGIPAQAFYGVRDYQAYSAPIAPNTLVTQVLTQNATTGLRSITGEQPPASVPVGAPIMLVGGLDSHNNPINVSVGPANGWRLPLNFAGSPEKGERADRRAIPYYSANIAVLYTMIPKGDDPCDPGRRFAVMAINAANGAAAFPGALGRRAGVGVTGQVTGSNRPIGDPIERPGGGLIIPGASADVTDAINASISPAPWHRAAWRELIDLR